MLLLLGALQADVFEQAIVVLRDLPQRRVRRRNNGNDLRQRGKGHFGTTMHAWHGNAPEPTVGECIDDVGGYFAGSITLRSLFAKQGCYLVGD
ncbi:hypothetical protein D3C79_1052710 [compost metagenome]